MRAAGHLLPVLSPAEESTIHANVLRIVERTGMLIENEALLEQTAAIGGRIDRCTRRVTFAPAETERFIADSERYDWDGTAPRLSAGASIYYGHYLDPETERFQPITVDNVRRYFQVAAALPHIDGTGMLGCPLKEVPPPLEPLYERYWSWQVGAHPGGSVHRVGLAPYIVEMCQAHAEASGKPFADVFGAGLYLQPPLKLGYQEAEQVEWFWRQGLRCSVGGSMATGGATAPVTLAGMVTLTIAENLLLGMLDRALYGDKTWGIWMAATALDPRTMMRGYGRPDQVLANLMGAQLAQRYGAAYSGHCGQADAARPSPEAAAQKVQSALPTLLATGHAGIAAGLLAIDEVFSPVQMALDDEITSSMRQFTADYEVSDEAIAADLIELVGPGGAFVAEEHTGRWFRRELWEPRLWQRQAFAGWLRDDPRTDLERARRWVLDIIAEPLPPLLLGDDEERRLKAIIDAAARAGV